MRGLVTIAVLELVYLLAANVFFLGPWAQRVLNPKPEKAALEYELVLTPWPGAIFVRGLRIDAENLRNQWFLSIDQGFSQISLVGLARKQVQLSWIRANGLDFRLRPQHLEPGEVDGEPFPLPPAGVAGYPEIPGRSLPSEWSAFDLQPPAERTDEDFQPWSFELGVSRAKGLHQVWVGNSSVTGDLSLRGNAAFRLQREHLEIRLQSLALSDAQLQSLGEVVAEPLALDITGQLGPLEPRLEEGLSFLRHLTATFDLEGDVHGLPVLGRVTAGVPTLDVDGAGELSSYLVIEKGRLVSPSRLRLDGSPSLSLLSFRGEGSGILEGTVEPVGDGDRTRLSLQSNDYRAFAVDRGSSEAVLRGPIETGRELAVTVTGPVLDLTSIEPPLVEVEALLPLSEIVSLSPLVRGLPRVEGLRVVASKGTIEGSLQADAGARGGAGHLTVDLSELDGWYREERIRGDLKLDVLGRELDLRERTGSFAGSTVVLRDLRVGDRQRSRRSQKSARNEASRDQPWKGFLRFDSGCIDLDRSVWLDAQIALAMTDAEPILALVSELKPSVGWIDRFLALPDLEGRGRLVAADSLWRLEKVALQSDHTELLTTLDFGSSPPSGVLFARWRKLSTAVHAFDGKRDWDLVRSRRWYLARERTHLARQPLAGCLGD